MCFRRLIGCLGLWVAIAIVLVLGLYVYAGIRTERRETLASDASDIPSDFPIVVTSSDKQNRSQKAEIVFHHALGEYLKGLDSYSFCIPDRKVGEMNNQIKRAKRLEDPFGKDLRRVELLRVFPDGSQYLKVTTAREKGMIIQTGWYVAHPRHITPRYYRTDNPMRQAVGAVIISMTISVVLTSIVYIAFFVYRRLKNRQA